MTFKQWEFPIYNFDKEKLGVAGTIAEPANLDTEDCFLISFLPSPIRIGSKNRYVVYVKDKTLAESIKKIQFTARFYRQSDIEPFELELAPPKFDIFEYQYMVIPYTPQKTGKLQIEVKLFTSDDVSAPKRRLFLEQWVKRPYPWMKCLNKLVSSIDQLTFPLSPIMHTLLDLVGGDTDEIAKSRLRVALLGDVDILDRNVDEFYPYVDNAYRLHDADNTRVPKELLIAIICQQISSKVIVSGKREPFSVGICGLRTGAVAIVAGLKGFDLENDRSDELQMNEAELVDGMKTIYFSLSDENPIDFEKDYPPNEIINDPCEKICGVWIEDSNAEQPKLDFLAMFPKSNIYLCYELLCRLKERRYGVETVLAQDTDKCKLLAAEFMKLQLELSTWEVKEDKDPLSSKNLTEIEKKAKDFADKVVGRLNTPYVALIKHAGLGARTVQATFKDGGKTITQISDPIPRGILKFEDSDKDILKAENFGWKLGEDIEKLSLSDVNDWEMVFMDVGFWGHYNRDNPRRDFGMIEGKHVWLCKLVYDDECVDDIHGETLIRLQLIFGPDNKSIAEELINELYDEWGYTVELVSYTEAPEPPMEQPGIFLADKLTIIFPDMHLPEKWPDIPDENIYPTNGHPNDQDRKDLRALLWSSQAMLDSDYAPRTQAERVQDYLANVLTDSAGNETFNLAGTTVEFTSSQFKAEYDLVERRIRLDNSWFYPSAVHYNPKIEPPWSDEHFIDRVQNHIDPQELQGDPAPAIDLAAMLFAIKTIRNKDLDKVKVLQAGDLYEMWMGNEWLYKDFPNHEKQELLDLKLLLTDLKLLLKLYVIDKTGGPGGFQYRLGKNWLDMYNSTMREWYSNLRGHYDGAYFFFTNHIINEFKFISLCDKMRENEDCELLKFFNENFTKSDGDYLFTGDNYDILYDKVYEGNFLYDIFKFFDNEIPLYIYHEWPIELLTIRKLTGLSINQKEDQNQEFQDILKRAKTEVLRRINAIKDFSLPWPDTSDCTSRKKTLDKLKIVYHGTGEFLWNKLLLDLFSKVNCIMVNGNHDGYRGDPLLKPETKADKEVEPWYSGDGLWVEHGHRWDPYNFDGMAFGPGVTNHVHYTMRPFIQWTDEVKGKFIPDFHTQTLPCSAQWFLLVNKLSKEGYYSPELGHGGKESNIEPFSVYIVGHSHTPDLLRVRFKKE